MPLPSEPTETVRSYALPAEENPFAELLASVRWEDVGKGRQGAVLTRIDAEGRAPLVRTTTRYGAPAQRFRPVHESLAHRIQELAALPTVFDNALIENYTNAYTTMGAHSDQALDLADGSFIAVFSCYRNPGAGPPRKLVFETKEPEGERFELPLAHNSAVVFSVAANRRLSHRIILDTSAGAPDNTWLGVTFRTSRTPVRYTGAGHAHLPGGERLLPADEEQRQEFYRLRRRENREPDFAYPAPLTYTISESDLLPPV
ncbi:alpha-ketoglutarate-dependent dioxygenase AlkB [Streptomyces sp. DH8]|uniref:alpha-ketoglutarate-dependent dioxygenase AlkB n=1 Tax=Streptomyces sp. DH8 TaxID=2857008 RepID=UPI001E5C3CA8|nr:alpha-ketoglutarate-dependent dioxygenase AlkB [Streptomyces sp. DH8]